MPRQKRITLSVDGVNKIIYLLKKWAIENSGRFKNNLLCVNISY